MKNHARANRQLMEPEKEKTEQRKLRMRNEAENEERPRR
jgi:hypothetical protein